MAEKETLTELQFITDDDTGMYEIGEMWGGFDPYRLEKYIRRFGPEELYKTLTHMSSQVFDTVRNINAEQSNQVAMKGTLPDEPTDSAPN